MNVKDNN